MRTDHMNETICLVRKEIAKKAERKRLSFWQFLKTQIRFIGWKIWLLQLGVLGVVCACMTGFFEKYYTAHPEDLPRLLMILAIIVLMTAIPFLYKIASNTCIDMWRKQETIKEFPEGMKLEQMQLQMDMSYEESGFQEVQALLDMQWMLRILPEEQREIVILRFSHDLTLREIADVTGIPFRTVQSRIRLALKKLKIEYGKEENDEN